LERSSSESSGSEFDQTQEVLRRCDRDWCQGVTKDVDAMLTPETYRMCTNCNWFRLL
jgi:hypothetical protein